MVPGSLVASSGKIGHGRGPVQLNHREEVYEAALWSSAIGVLQDMGSLGLVNAYAYVTEVRRLVIQVGFASRH